MKLAKIFLVLAALVLSANVVSVQAQPQAQQKEAPHPKSFSGNDANSFKSWVQRELRDEFSSLKRGGAKVHGTIKVNFEVEPNGRIVPLKHEDLKAHNKALDPKVNSAINRVLTAQKWTVKGAPKKQVQSMILTF